MTFWARFVFFSRHDGVALAVPLMAFAALDLGARRIGIAVTDARGLATHPLCTIDRHRSIAADIEAIKLTFGSREIECLIVGLPVNMDGSEGPMARHARNFAARLLRIRTAADCWAKGVSSLSRRTQTGPRWCNVASGYLKIC